jgi:single-strand DNA-binding protein
MTNCNRVSLTGRVASSPHRSYRPDGSSVIQFSLEFSDQEGPFSRQGRSSIDIAAVDHPDGLNVNDLQVGTRLFIEGRLKQRRWKTSEGKSRSQFEVIAATLRMLKEDEPTEERRR